MSNNPPRILPTEVIKNPASPSHSATRRNIPLSPQFETKEEYIKFLLDTNKISYDKLRIKNSIIYLKGHLHIDERVKSGLDWSDVVVTSATVASGKISKYAYLPCSKAGVKSNLHTLSIDEFMKHNAYHAQKKNGKYIVPGIFRIPAADILPDFSLVQAEKVYCYYNGKVNLERLPYASKGIFGIKAENIITPMPNALRTAKAKGLGKNICRELKKREPGLWQKWIVTFGFKSSY